MAIRTGFFTFPFYTNNFFSHTTIFSKLASPVADGNFSDRTIVTGVNYCFARKQKSNYIAKQQNAKYAQRA